MDNIRLILTVTLVFILMLMYQAWLEDYGEKSEPTPSRPTATTSMDSETDSENELPQPVNEASTSDSLPSVGSAPNEVPSAGIGRLLPTDSRVVVKTDVLLLEIDTRGGDIRQIDLLKYPVELDKPDEPFRLFNDKMPHIFVAQSGLLPQSYAPTHQSHYQAERQFYTLTPGDDRLEVVLTWQNDAGIKVKKIYTLTRDSYVINLQQVVSNQSDKPWSVRLYGQLQRTQIAEVGQSSFIYTYMGGAISSPESVYEKISFSEIKNNELGKENRQPWQNGWLAMLQHYFVAALVPPSDQEFNYYTNFMKQGNRYILGMYGPTQNIAPNSEQSFNLQLFAGPKIQEQLETLAPGLDLTVDYGWLWFIAKPLFWGLEMIHDLVGNWGWAIVILTLLIKIAFFQLSATSYKSMANMRRLQPRLKQLQERYADDKSKLNQAMMDLYRKEKINPLGGCLPILVQIPVFIALYWVLLESVELRHAPFILWIQDLSSPDPYFVLPLVMGVTMFLQNYLNPAPLDPMQQKVMMLLPIVFTVFFAFFPSGLVLYWMINNILSIAQQWFITRKIAGNVK